MAEGHVSMSGTLISQKPVIAEQREEVVETIKSVEQPHVSMRGQLITKRIQEAVDVIQGGIQAMEQPQSASEDPDRQFYQSTVPMEQRNIQPEETSLRPKARPTNTTDNNNDVADEVRPSDGKDRILSLSLPDEVKEDKAFLDSVKKVSNNLEISEEDLLRAISFETIGTFSPSIKSKNSSATGLIQFIENTAESLGTSTEELSQMTREQQMTYVEKYLMQYKGRMKDFGDIYMAIHLPAAVGKPDDTVIYNNTDLRTKAYEANKNLDVNEDGKVTKGEAVSRAAKG